MGVDMPYISDFLGTPGVEGKQQLCGYVPAKPGNYTGQPDPQRYTAIAYSGVTLARGCDLGQTNASTMLGYGLCGSTVNQLRPYFGLKKAAAIAKLHEVPLVVSQTTANEIDHAVHNGYLKYVISAYDKEANTSFSALPKQAQAVIFSLCFQKGCTGVRKDWPKVWGHLVREDWRAASNELLTGFNLYKLRRRIEGELLMEVC